MGSYLVNPLTVAPFQQIDATAGLVVPVGFSARVPTAVGPLSLLCPAAPADQAVIAVADVDGSANVNPITLNGNGKTIDGAAAVALSVNGVKAVFVFDVTGNEWRRVEEFRVFDDEQRLPIIPFTGVGGAGAGIGVRAYATIAQAVDQIGTWVPINFTAENYDDANFHDNVVDPSRITIPSGQGGRYSIVAQVNVGPQTGIRLGRIRKNAATQLSVTVLPTAAAAFFGTSIWVETVEDLAAGEYIEIEVASGGGGAPISTIALRDQTFICVQKVR